MEILEIDNVPAADDELAVVGTSICLICHHLTGMHWGNRWVPLVTELHTHRICNREHAGVCLSGATDKSLSRRIILLINGDS